jgi:hypothetical protein
VNEYMYLALTMMDIRVRIEVHYTIPANICVRTPITNLSTSESVVVSPAVSIDVSVYFTVKIKR